MEIQHKIITFAKFTINNKKKMKLITTLLSSFMATLAFAVPAKRGIWRTVTLTDGTQIRAELRGDESCRYWQTADGSKLVTSVKTGLCEYADMSTILARTARKRQSARRAGAATISTRGAIGGEHQPYIGKKKGLIILVDFADKTFKEEHTPNLYRRIANEEGFSEMGFYGSVKDYFKAQSYGQFELDFDIAGPVSMPEGYAYYGGPSNGESDNYEAIAQMIIDACKSVDDDINFADYDWDGDGEVDQVFILYAGHGEASWDDEDTIWPHEWELDSALYPMKNTLTLDGVRINTYACSCELGSIVESNKLIETIDGIGTICHEFSHCLGLPDTYDTSYSGYYGMNVWDIMDYGSYNDNGFLPANYTSYERMYTGWTTPTELSNDTTVSAMTPLSENGESYIIYNDNNKNEYYLLENRQQTGWDAALPNSGMLILHVDYDKSVWANNMVNSTSRQRCTIFIADNRPNSNDAGDIYPNKDNNCLTNTSTPAATLYNNNIDGTKYMNKAVRDITRNEDGTMSFSFENLNTTSIKTLKPNTTDEDRRIFGIDGRYLGKKSETLKKGIYIINKKKIVK